MEQNDFFRNKVHDFLNKTDSEILDYLSDFWGISPDSNGVFTLVASYEKSAKNDKNGNPYAFFVDVRNTSGDILYYPFGLGKVILWTKCNPKFENQECWLINVKLSEKKYRDRQPFLLSLANSIDGNTSLKYKEKIEREKFIRTIFKTTGSTERDARIEVNALHNIMDDLYTNADDRFVYELLQNADDQPIGDNGVDVSLAFLQDNLLFMHNGKVFDEDDVNSICSIGDSTKRKDKEKIGYKGIGFKSVFSGAETVIVNSGNYSFAFDKYSTLYRNQDTESIPWQLKPIWQEKYRYPKEIIKNDLFWKSNVGIALTVGREKNLEYSDSVFALFNKPEFILFLKNVSSISCVDRERERHIRKQKEYDKLSIFIDDIVSIVWSIKDYVIDIPIDIKDALQSDRNAPRKMKEATLTQISFAAKIKEDKRSIEQLSNSLLFAYLPTSVNDFKFNFIVNADFLLAANREQLHSNKVWNQFLFSKIGEYLIPWVKGFLDYSNYLELLPCRYLPEEEQGHMALSKFFNESYRHSLESESFILNHSGVLAKQEEIILDRTGIGTKSSPLLSHILGEDLFCEILQTNKQLPNRRIKCSILSHQIFEKIQKIDPVEIIPCLVDNELLKKWYIGAEIEEKDIFDKWIVENNGLDVICTLPIFSIDECWMSFLDIKKYNNLILLNDKLFPLRGLLEKLGYRCSVTTIEKCRFFDQIEPINEKALFETIISHPKVGDLSTAEKVGLIKMDFKDVGEKTIARVLLFRNQEGELAPLEKMVPYRDSAPTFLSRFMISKEEYNEELHPLLINPEDEFLKIVWPNITTIEESPINIINHYQLEGRYIQHFIKKCQNNEELSQLLSIVENADKVTKDCYLNQISRIDLNENVRYTKDSFEYRVLKMVIETREEPSLYSRKIFFQNRCLSDFTIDDKVKCDNVEMSLAKILPQFQNQSDTINKIKSLFESFEKLDLFFVTSTIPLSQIAKGLESPDSLQLRPGLWPLDKGGNAIQYLFYVYYYKKVKGYTSSYVISIELEKETDSFVFELMDFLFINELDIRTSPFTYRIVRYFSNKYFPSRFVLKDEELCSSIVKWADNGEKIEYLKRNGVRLESHPSIVLRKAFLQNQILDVEKLTKDNGGFYKFIF